MNDHELNYLTDAAYTAYCQSVGGKAFNGDPLPRWATFSTDNSKSKQANAWREAVKAVVKEIEKSKRLEEKIAIMKSGNAAITSMGEIVDRRYRPDAMPFTSRLEKHTHE